MLHPTISRSRRRKVIRIHENDVLSCFSLTSCLPNDCVVRLSLDVPQDTVVIGRFYDYRWQCEMIIVVNEAWPEVVDGAQLDVLDIKSTLVVAKLDLVRRENNTQPLFGRPGVTALAEFLNPALGEPYPMKGDKEVIENVGEVPNPFEKSWREKDPLL